MAKHFYETFGQLLEATDTDQPPLDTSEKLSEDASNDTFIDAILKDCGTQSDELDEQDLANLDDLDDILAEFDPPVTLAGEEEAADEESQPKQRRGKSVPQRASRRLRRLQPEVGLDLAQCVKPRPAAKPMSDEWKRLKELREVRRENRLASLTHCRLPSERPVRHLEVDLMAPGRSAAVTKTVDYNGCFRSPSDVEAGTLRRIATKVRNSQPRCKGGRFVSKVS